ncbi:MAG: efflux RND transporter periplasmic adaptor subunit [Myxococcota bacterium]
MGPALAWGATLAALVALSTACGPDGAEAVSDHRPKPAIVETLRIEPQLLRDVVTLSGQLDAEHSVILKPETSGVIEFVEFEEGQTVQQGTILFRLRREEQKARLWEALANRALADDVYERATQLVTRAATSLAQRDRAAAELEVARARVDLARLELNRTKIRAPFDGAVGVRYVDPGDRVNDETPLVRIDALERLQVSFAVSEQGVAFAKTGVPVEIRVLPYPGERFPGTVFFVSPTLDAASRRLLLKAWVPNADLRLRPGLFANVDVEIARRENSLLVPEIAVEFDRQGAFVWRVRADETVERVPIQIGLRKNGRVEVTMGLRPGDTVVTAGTHKISEGKRIQSASAPGSGVQSGQARREASSEVGPGEGT